MIDEAFRTSRRYAAAQTAILCAFTTVLLFDRAPFLFESSAARIAGGILSAAGLLLMFAALVSLRRAVQIAPEPRADAELVTSGVYARFRHPIYTAIVAIVAGLFLRQPTMAVAAASGAVIIFLARKVRFEEMRLAARYPAYPAYKRRTWGLFPPM